MTRNIQFESDNIVYKSTNNSTGKQGVGMMGWLIKHGLARSNNSAQTILIGVIIVNFLITFLIIKYLL